MMHQILTGSAIVVAIVSVAVPGSAAAAETVTRSRLANGAPGFVTGELGTVGTVSRTRAGRAHIDDGTTDTSELRNAATRYLNAYATDNFRPSGSETFHVVTVRDDGRSDIHVKFRQRIHKLPVFDARLLVHLARDNGAVYAVNGEFLRGDDAARTPEIGSARAIAAGRAQFSGDRTTVTVAPRLGYTFKKAEMRPVLAWKLRVRRGAANSAVASDVYVNALTGVVEQVVDLTHAANPYIYDANNTAAFPGRLVCSGQQACPNGPSHWARVNFATTLEFFRSVYGRNSWDDAGGRVDATVRYRENPNVPEVNAFWSSSAQRFGFGNGDGVQTRTLSRALDVVAHEFMHAVTDSDSQLFNRFESGAIDEGISDVIGAAISAWSTGNVDASTWQLGEDAFINNPGTLAFRYMSDPARTGRNVDFYPYHYLGTASSRHRHSSLVSLPFYLLSQGGRHPRGRTTYWVPGIGIEKARDIFYYAQRDVLSPQAGFRDLRAATRTVAQRMYGTREAEAVDLAWCAVGVPGCPFGDAVIPSQYLPVSFQNRVERKLGTIPAIGSRHGAIEVPNGATRLIVRTYGGSGDVEVFVNRGSRPTIDQIECADVSLGSMTRCVIESPAAGRWFYLVSSPIGARDITMIARWQ